MGTHEGIRGKWHFPTQIRVDSGSRTGVASPLRNAQTLKQRSHRKGQHGGNKPGWPLPWLSACAHCSYAGLRHEARLPAEDQGEGIRRRTGWRTARLIRLIHINSSKSLPELQKTQQRLLFFLKDRRGPNCIASSFLGFLEVVEDSALGDAEHVPNAVEVGLILVLHSLQSFIDSHHSLLNCLHLQLDKG